MGLSPPGTTYAPASATWLNASGGVAWTADGVPVCTATGSQNVPRVVRDFAGGAIVAWNDARTGTYDIYAQRLNNLGAPQWAADGVSLCTATGDQRSVAAIPDGAGGIIAVWHDRRAGVTYDLYAQRVNDSGAVQWAADGVALSVSANDQRNQALVSDNGGGVIVAWEDLRTGTSDVHAQRISGAGEPLWTADGRPVCDAVGAQSGVALAGDGAGNVVVAWADLRSGASYDIYAQNVTVLGVLGPQPSITQVRDVINDQGGYVQLEWLASYIDVAPDYPIADYSVWRRVPGGAVAPAAVRVAAERAPGLPMHIVTGSGTAALYWEYLATMPARGLPGYSYVARTTSDSLPGSNPMTSFMVMAEKPGGTPYWMSAPDSGYSVDNLAPAAPAPFTGEYASGTTTLRWSMVDTPDLAGFRLYRGVDAGFIPGPPNRIAELTTTTYVDATGAPSYYKLCAVDEHGNAGSFATLDAASTVGVAGWEPGELTLANPLPNPVRFATTLHFALPRRSRVSLALFDAQGRWICDLVRAEREAGQHAISWDGRNAAGESVASGLYFVRLESAGRVLARRVINMR